MKSSVLGMLSVYEDIDEWFAARNVEIPFLSGQKIDVIFDGVVESDIPAFDEATSKFLKLGMPERAACSVQIFQNYKAMVAAIGSREVGCEIQSEADVWNHVKFSSAFVKRNKFKDKKVYVVLGGNCAWEPEHGIQLVFREGHELTRVSGQDGGI